PFSAAERQLEEATAGPSEARTVRIAQGGEFCPDARDPVPAVGARHCCGCCVRCGVFEWGQGLGSVDAVESGAHLEAIRFRGAQRSATDDWFDRRRTLR